MYVAIRTDKPEAEIYLLHDDGSVSNRKIWLAGRTLARDLPGEIDCLVAGNYDQLNGVIIFRGPGSFTGLRIGITVANAISYVRQLPIVGTVGDSWMDDGTKRLNDGETDHIVVPEYGAAPHITPARK